MYLRRLLPIALALAVLLAGCGPAQDATTGEPDAAPPAETPTTPDAGAAQDVPAWLDIELTDAVTGQRFRLTDFKGKQVLLHPFAAW
jgi:cytochrome oxidase Cu insertion factor (SCO1/SenC/PrrC family)